MLCASSQRRQWTYWRIYTTPSKSGAEAAISLLLGSGAQRGLMQNKGLRFM